MVTFREAVANAARGSLCAVIAVNDDAAKLFGRLPGLAGPADYANFFAPLRAQLCDENPEDYEPPVGPFTGGQCAGVNYRIDWSWSAGSFNSGPQTSERVGPLSFSTEGTGSLDCGPGGGTYNVFTVVDGTGQSPLSLAAGCDAQLNSLTVTRIDGQPDNCGDPPIPVPPPGPVQRPVNITFNTEQGDEVTIEGDWTFSPFFSVGDLSIKVPFTLDLGGFEWSGNIEVSPEFNLEIAPRINLGGGGTPDDPGTLLPVPPEDTEDVDPDPLEPAIIGVVIRSSPIGELRDTAIATVGMPTIYAPRIASCSFAIQSGFTVAWTPDIDVKNRDCYIPCPAPQGAVGVSVSPSPGWETSWVAVRGRPLTPPT